MSEKQTLNREGFLKSINLVRPALSSQAFIPSLTHVAFNDGMVMAYNDITAIGVECSFDRNICLPGDFLIKLLGNLSADEVVVQDVDKSSLQFSGGRSKLKIPYLPIDDFPFHLSSDDSTYTINITPDIITGIEKCLISVGSDPTHPAQMGVTLESGGTLYSTNNFSISRYRTKEDIKLEGDVPVIFPTFFCHQLIAMARNFPDLAIDLELRNSSATAWFGDKAFIFTKVQVDVEPMDFERIIKKHCSDAAIKDFSDLIPDAFDSAFERALLVLSDEMDKSTKVSIGDGKLRLLSTCPRGEADDSMRFKGESESGEDFYVDPTLVVRASKVCNKLAALKDVLILTNEDATFTHLIAHHSV
jgi:DNA polymerase III sliding clamp (beta) subunit (PCNA family)